MVSFSIKTVTGVTAALLMAQQCQCPPIAVPLFISAAAQTAAAVGSAGASFAGAIIAANAGGGKRAVLYGRQSPIQAPAGVPQQEFERCYTDLSQASVAINVQGPVQNNGIRVEGLPASCMNLATVLDGDAAGGPVPQPCGSACLLYDNLSPEDYEKMRTTFEGIKNA
ncbi:hypothetical protein FZEAL_3496 [Fusarium zealandicum]|uniref:Uncharacterized protein n=1 Tax=Fusarium zealandicum TaxID=1053134 RepID=A0A8H4UPH4_9HYPO|nr:hypothetical protein FZEAL_3496 [Fusarium zealandicum]